MKREPAMRAKAVCGANGKPALGAAWAQIELTSRAEVELRTHHLPALWALEGQRLPQDEVE
ncbi:MAG TPA: hypothetical protein VMI06_03575 [Terriglobia bacterium]|nr:hypothetical protein [Terriglobia bacterium]